MLLSVNRGQQAALGVTVIPGSCSTARNLEGAH